MELLDWCNRHGAGIDCSPDYEHADMMIFTYLVTSYPELSLMFVNIQTEGPNYINGRDQKTFMEMLRKKYGD